MFLVVPARGSSRPDSVEARQVLSILSPLFLVRRRSRRRDLSCHRWQVHSCFGIMAVSKETRDRAPVTPEGRPPRSESEESPMDRAGPGGTRQAIAPEVHG